MSPAGAVRLRLHWRNDVFYFYGFCAGLAQRILGAVDSTASLEIEGPARASDKPPWQSRIQERNRS